MSCLPTDTPPPPPPGSLYGYHDIHAFGSLPHPYQHRYATDAAVAVKQEILVPPLKKVEETIRSSSYAVDQSPLLSQCETPSSLESDDSNCSDTENEDEDDDDHGHEGGTCDTTTLSAQDEGVHYEIIVDNHSPDKEDNVSDNHAYESKYAQLTCSKAKAFKCSSQLNGETRRVEWGIGTLRLMKQESNPHTLWIWFGKYVGATTKTMAHGKLDVRSVKLLGEETKSFVVKLEEEFDSHFDLCYETNTYEFRVKDKTLARKIVDTIREVAGREGHP